jgi:hypothetical protein
LRDGLEGSLELLLAAPSRERARRNEEDDEDRSPPPAGGGGDDADRERRPLAGFRKRVRLPRLRSDDPGADRADETADDQRGVDNDSSAQRTSIFAGANECGSLIFGQFEVGRPVS